MTEKMTHIYSRAVGDQFLTLRVYADGTCSVGARDTIIGTFRSRAEAMAAAAAYLKETDRYSEDVVDSVMFLENWQWHATERVS